VRYIHLNPVRAGLVKRPSEWSWSGHGEYLGRDKRGLIDEQGNYIFRFSQSLSDIAEEASDVGPGESLSAQIFPDAIVQALGTVGILDRNLRILENLRRISVSIRVR